MNCAKTPLRKLILHVKRHNAAELVFVFSEERDMVKRLVTDEESSATVPVAETKVPDEVRPAPKPSPRAVDLWPLNEFPPLPERSDIYTF